MLGGTPPSDALIPGNYSPVQPFTNLVGCPLNGPWVFSIYDLWSGDNGFICDWWIDFRPGLSPGAVQFTPSIGFTDSDSASWSGEGLFPETGNPAICLAIPTSTGPHTYTFAVTNNFGCSYDTSLNVMVGPGDFGSLVISGDTAVCGNDEVTLSAPPGFDGYAWSNGLTTPTVDVGGGIYTVELTLGNCSIVTEPFEVNSLQPPETPQITWNNMMLSSTVASAYQWFLYGTPIDGATGQSFFPTDNGSYTVEVTDLNSCTALSDPYLINALAIGSAQVSRPTISPQPANGSIIVSGLLAGPFYRIFDMQGHLLLAGPMQSSPQLIRVDMLSSGMYVLEITDQQELWRSRVLVE
jgi:hypothetical protein